MIDERVEHLVSRSLDGELTEAESLELNRLLIRSPEARALMEEHERTGTLAGEALRAAFADGASSDERAGQLARAAVSRRRPWPAMRRAPAVAAAVLVGMIIGGGAGHWAATRAIPAAPEPAGIDPAHPPLVAGAVPVEDDSSAIVVEGPRRHEQRTVHDIFGVFDEETQSVYLLEASRTQTNVVPASANY